MVVVVVMVSSGYLVMEAEVVVKRWKAGAGGWAQHQRQKETPTRGGGKSEYVFIHGECLFTGG